MTRFCLWTIRILRYVDENQEMEDKEESKGVVNNKADDSAPTTPLVADPEPIHAPNNHVVNHNSPTPANEDTENSKEASHPLDNGKVLVAEKVVVPEHPIVSSQNDAPPVTKTPASKTQDEVPKKSFASVVHDLKKSNSPFNVVLRVPPVKFVEQSRVTAAAAIETAPNSNSSVDKNNNNAAVKGHSIFAGNLPDTATAGQLEVVFEQFGPIKPDGIQVRSQKQTGNCFGFVEFESASSEQSVLKASPISIGNRRAAIEVKRV
ncbi:nuclear transport factor 2-like isoform X1 [Pistacia vera]|uniref:nuclear transport factor 2-like isoform X1 n=1 Tax=Pistacia vera TaxID=55513 RepID=UPI001263A7A7|nr:nuclear transport factor 2-like isoform X1 [Pistacia vera]XP_031281516.1 nuclear transport factor 2-like isoform X1 [Pistacia vera]XP_031281523.1 nuclear transport factor 2-like isoform X1 [Pistacia vera]XP_031281530.1 nuclear transport factor 2-like isoform X1 [Pistacia vera]XP_031281535.1 nuclear transport factor 2-like isoform X1 [Pistacia vera]XP_031281539.1 nuclear transport factor 2-like isoform X1 [Pistacia vera]XP_031281543.1 nuclear transport factor 2-like isoform X1 [Pistacia ver